MTAIEAKFRRAKKLVGQNLLTKQNFSFEKQRTFRKRLLFEIIFTYDKRSVSNGTEVVKDIRRAKHNLKIIIV